MTKPRLIKTTGLSEMLAKAKENKEKFDKLSPEQKNEVLKEVAEIIAHLKH